MIEFSSVIKWINNSIYAVPFFNTILSNVIYTAIVLSILLIIILVAIYPCKNGTTGWIFVKLFLYLTIINAAILSAYQSVISNKYKDKYSETASNDFMNTINNKSGGTIYAEMHKKVMPDFKDRRDSSEDDHNGHDYKHNHNNDDEGRNATEMLDDIDKRL